MRRSLLRALCAASLALTVALTPQAQPEPVLLAENVQILFPSVSFTPSYIPFDGGLTFAGISDNTGSLWTTDGTPETTRRIDFVPGASPEFPQAPLATFGGDLYFWGRTPGGVARLYRIAAGGDLPEQVTNAEYVPETFHAESANRFYFAGCDNGTGCEPYRATPQATSLLKDIREGGGDSDPTGFKSWQGQTYFVALDPVLGREIWTTAGTEGTTVLSVDLNTGTQGTAYSDLLAGTTSLYFIAEGNENGSDEDRTGLWSSQGGASNLRAFLSETGASDKFIGEVAGIPLVAARADLVNGQDLGVELFGYRDGALTLIGDLYPGNQSSLNQIGESAADGGEVFLEARTRLNNATRELVFRTDGVTASRIELPGLFTLEVRIVAQDADRVYLLADVFDTAQNDASTQVWTVSGGTDPVFFAQLPDGLSAVNFEALRGGLVFNGRVGSSQTRNVYSLGVPPPVASGATPEAAALSLSASPSPTRGATSLAFSMPAAGDARLSVYDLLGREVSVLASGPHASGDHAVRWDASGVPSGVYLARLTTADASVARRVVITR